MQSNEWTGELAECIHMAHYLHTAQCNMACCAVTCGIISRRDRWGDLLHGPVHDPELCVTYNKCTKGQTPTPWARRRAQRGSPQRQRASPPPGRACPAPGGRLRASSQACTNAAPSGSTSREVVTAGRPRRACGVRNLTLNPGSPAGCGRPARPGRTCCAARSGPRAAAPRKAGCQSGAVLATGRCRKS